MLSTEWQGTAIHLKTCQEGPGCFFYVGLASMSDNAGTL